MARSLVVCPEGIKLAISALTTKGWSREVLAGKVTVETQKEVKSVSKQTIDKFFAGKAVDRSYFAAICNTLQLDWEIISGVKILPIEVPPSAASGNSDRLQPIIQSYLDFLLKPNEEQIYIDTDAVLQQETRKSGKKGEQREETKEEQPPQPVVKKLLKDVLGDRREHVILSGRPGSGKSTALQQLRLALAAEGLVPVLVQLKYNIPILEAIANELEKGDLELEPGEIKRLLRNQELILLLNGVNEIPTDDLRRGLDYFREQNSTVSMIFTTRDLALGGDLGTSQRLEMKPLTVLQMQEFVGQHLPEVGGKLLEQLGDRLREVAETPLLLEMLCNVFGETGQIPENKGDLFRLFHEKYKKFKELPDDSQPFTLEILQQLAFVMMTGAPSKPTEFWLTIDRGLAERKIEKFLRERQESDAPSKSKKWLGDLLKHHYLLQVAADAGQIEFHHQLFQEYYAAERLLSLFDDDNNNDVTDEQRLQHLYLNYSK